MFEACIVAAKASSKAISLIHGFLDVFNIQVVEFNSEQSYLAARVYQKYGKGNHQARLNFGDCATYALAVYLKAKLLYKGNDFVHTDIIKAI